MSALGYALQEAFVTLRRAGRTAAMSIGTIAVAFLTLGGFLLAAANLQAIAERWAAAAEMSVYLRDDLDEAAREALAGELRTHAAVAGVEYVSRDQARERFGRDFPELADLAEAGESPFPASLEVRLRDEGAAADAVRAMAAEIATRPGVVDVRYDQEWLARLQSLIDATRIGGLAVAAILVIGAAFTVSAVVRLSMHTRREEIDIMQLVGAPYAFIRGPSIAEGTLLGGAGAVLSLLALWIVFAGARPYLQDALTAWGGGGLRFLSLGEAAVLVAAGVIVGAGSGWIAARSVR